MRKFKFCISPLVKRLPCSNVTAVFFLHALLKEIQHFNFFYLKNNSIGKLSWLCWKQGVVLGNFNLETALYIRITENLTDCWWNSIERRYSSVREIWYIVWYVFQLDTNMVGAKPSQPVPMSDIRGSKALWIPPPHHALDSWL